jgi:hypothetical protein
MSMGQRLRLLGFCQKFRDRARKRKINKYRDFEYIVH